MTTLYNLSNEFMQKLVDLHDRAENGETVTNDEFNQVLELGKDTEKKLVSCGYAVKNLLSDCEQIDLEIKRLQDMKLTKANRVEWIKTNMKTAMQVMGLDKVKDPVLPISLRQNPQFSVNVENVERLPAEYRVIKVEPNKKALLDAYKASNDFAIDGVTFTKGQFIKIG